MYPFTESTKAEGTVYAVREADDVYANTTAQAFSASGPWTAAMFGAQWFLAGDTAFVFSVPQYTGRPNAADHIRICCCANFNNRLVLGGLLESSAPPNYFTTARFVGAFKRWRTFTEDQTESGQTIGDNYVFWSRENGGDVDSPFAAELALFGCPNNAAHDELLPDIYDALGKGEIGFVRTTVGSVRAVKQLGANLMVYGSKGVSVFPAGDNGAPIPAEVLILGRGIPGSGAVGGSLSKHVFVDNALEVWELDSDLQLQRRGFSEILGDHFTADSNAIVSYDEAHDEAYIAYDANTGFLLDGRGRLSQPRSAPSSLLLVGDDIVGTALDADEELLGNGDFASDTVWTKGAGWTIVGGMALFAKKAGNLYQEPTITADRVYRLKYTFSSLASGHVVPQVKITCGGVLLRIVDADGSFEDYFTSADTTGLFFAPDLHTSGVLDNVSLAASRRFYINTGRLHLGVACLKRLTAIEVIGDSIGGLEVAVLWRMKAHDGYTQNDWQRATDEGAVVPWISARDFQILVRGYLVDNEPDASAVSTIPRINVRWQFADLRHIRGQSGAE